MGNQKCNTKETKHLSEKCKNKTTPELCSVHQHWAKHRSRGLGNRIQWKCSIKTKPHLQSLKLSLISDSPITTGFLLKQPLICPSESMGQKDRRRRKFLSLHLHLEDKKSVGQCLNCSCCWGKIILLSNRGVHQQSEFGDHKAHQERQVELGVHWQV